jgi:A/G-specific adenine glycosylase
MPVCPGRAVLADCPLTGRLAGSPAVDAAGEFSMLGVLQRLLLEWYAAEGRSLPWRRTRDPYRILVSEVMLQQTQTRRVGPAYEAFLERFPTAAAVAAASLADVLTAWRGLGYNRRAVSLHRAAGVIAKGHGGRVPPSYAELRALPGVGDYTARAVLAFAFGADAGPVDTNIARVLARAVAGRPLSRGATQAVADAAVPPNEGPAWNHALMDLGARYCRARSPRCDSCPVAAACAWRAAGGCDPATPAAAAAGQARSARTAAPFAGSDRFHRGRLVDALRVGPVHRDRLAMAAAIEDPARLGPVVEGLVADGLAEWAGTLLRLPQASRGDAK